ncbi:helix-turn-helix transcriptional regulator [Vibrio sp. 1580]|nr:helix-turn-helix transcriptional regulator [Vibrio sp. 1580]MDW2104778.1 helix-turn-helix transcriptional regulator [Vibrio sp. 1580]HCM0490484.1 helix-turn-helix transcriptional regulator [Vibrio parahaemolyticus]
MLKETSLVTIIGLCLKELRVSKKITQSDMADHIGMTNAGWGRLENGKASISVENMALACEYLLVSLEDMFFNINRVSEGLKNEGWIVHTRRIDNDGLIIGREIESSYEKLQGRLSVSPGAATMFMTELSPIAVKIGASVGTAIGKVASIKKKKSEPQVLIEGVLVKKAAAAFEWGNEINKSSDQSHK